VQTIPSRHMSHFHLNFNALELCFLHFVIISTKFTTSCAYCPPKYKRLHTSRTLSLIHAQLREYTAILMIVPISIIDRDEKSRFQHYLCSFWETCQIQNFPMLLDLFACYKHYFVDSGAISKKLMVKFPVGDERQHGQN